ncbi:MAG TPA: helix-turn-helix transcriptional regulator [Tepidisphaeraceae bacterium]|nr:helix-turn-helix transcriptional regulator [Tepidisphaeraceae bacterium]
MPGTINTATIDGKRYVLVPEADYKRLKAGTKIVVPERELPAMPRKLPNGNYNAVDYARVSLARKIIVARKEAGLSQAQLARAAGIRPEVLNRIERARVSADTGTVAKIEAGLSAKPARRQSARANPQ